MGQQQEAGEGMSDTEQVEQTNVSRSTDYQGVTIWLGDGAPCHIDDTNNPEDIAGWICHPIQRAVTIARLRAVIAALEGDES